jgi:hypothetical protein
MDRLRAAFPLDPAAARLLVRLGLIGALAFAGFLAFAWYDKAALGLAPLGEMPPLYSPYHLARTAFALLCSVLAAAAIWRGRAPGCPLDSERMPAGGATIALLVLGLALASSLLFLADIGTFARFAQEDGPVEWPSTLLLLGASLLFGAAALGRAQRGGRVSTGLALLLALLMFVMAMEEISWMQRVVGFETPEELARVNWQGEFNFHNVQTDLSENLFYVGAAGLLIGLPLLADALPRAALPRWLGEFVPGRWVAAASAPLSIFNYGMWNVIPMQMSFFLTLFALAVWAIAAGRRGDRGESRLFAALALAVAAGQAAFLLRGDAMPDIWDASEYKELFIALGLACWAAGAATRSAGREAAASG